jgi:serine kinase of HPr protein (carbohydrate metabolism regulator)
MLVHATTVDIAGLGVLILGDSGSGKSDLALRLIGGGALLVSDDQTELVIDGVRLKASAPRTIAGLIEIRGSGIGAAPLKRSTHLSLAIELVAGVPERMPEPRTWSLPGHENPRIPMLALDGLAASAPEKVRHALVAVPPA